jgi:hypothetical protein
MDLSIDPGLMSHLITFKCSERAVASTRIRNLTKVQWVYYAILINGSPTKSTNRGMV